MSSQGGNRHHPERSLSRMDGPCNRFDRVSRVERDRAADILWRQCCPPWATLGIRGGTTEFSGRANRSALSS